MKLSLPPDQVSCNRSYHLCFDTYRRVLSIAISVSPINASFRRAVLHASQILSLSKIVFFLVSVVLSQLLSWVFDLKSHVEQYFTCSGNPYLGVLSENLNDPSKELRAGLAIMFVNVFIANPSLDFTALLQNYNI